MTVELVWDTGLNQKQMKQFKELKKLSKKDPFLNGYGAALRYPYVLLNENKDVVGTFDAVLQEFEGTHYARATNPYVLPQYRKHGYMKLALQEYFETRRPAIAFIVDTNKPSIALFTSLGFKKWKRDARNDLGSGYYYKLT